MDKNELEEIELPAEIGLLSTSLRLSALLPYYVIVPGSRRMRQWIRPWRSRAAARWWPDGTKRQ